MVSLLVFRAVLAAGLFGRCVSRPNLLQELFGDINSVRLLSITSFTLEAEEGSWFGRMGGEPWKM